MNNYFTTTVQLLNHLADNGFPAQLQACRDGWQLLFPWFEGGDIACNSATGGRLESYGFPWDGDDVTHDTMNGFRHRLAVLWEQVTY